MIVIRFPKGFNILITKNLSGESTEGLLCGVNEEKVTRDYKTVIRN